jgi:hypothetical protein
VPRDGAVLGIDLGDQKQALALPPAEAGPARPAAASGNVGRWRATTSPDIS